MQLFGKRFLEPPVQRMLERPGDYDKPISINAVATEVVKLDELEGRNFCRALELERSGPTLAPITLRELAGILDTLRASRHVQQHPDSTAFVENALRGGETIMMGLVSRANAAARGIHSGADLGALFGGRP